MRLTKAIGSTENDKSWEMEIGENIQDLTCAGAAFRQPENGSDDMSANTLGTLLRRATNLSMREVESLIDELHALRKKLETDGDRIQSDFIRYTELSQGGCCN